YYVMGCSKLKKLAISSCIFLSAIILFGCTNQTSEIDDSTANENEGSTALPSTQGKEQIIPEPYSKALLSIKSQNYEMAYNYLNLVLSDFPESDYALPAHLLKG